MFDRAWMIKTEMLGGFYERGSAELSEFTNDQLHYLIYENFGHSFEPTTKETKSAIKELVSRGAEYDPELAKQINQEIEECFTE